MRRTENIVKTAQQRLLRQQNVVLEDAGHLFGQLVLRDAVVVIQTGLCTPADMQRGVNVGFGPVHDLDQLRPVFNLLKRERLYRCAGDDETVVFLIPDVIKRLVEGEQMIFGRVFGVVALGLDQIDFDLDRGVG